MVFCFENCSDLKNVLWLRKTFKFKAESREFEKNWYVSLVLLYKFENSEIKGVNEVLNSHVRFSGYLRQTKGLAGNLKPDTYKVLWLYQQNLHL